MSEKQAHPDEVNTIVPRYTIEEATPLVVDKLLACGFEIRTEKLVPYIYGVREEMCRANRYEIMEALENG